MLCATLKNDRYIVTEELKISIEGLYTAFSRYPFRSRMDGCPCCVSDTDKETIHTKQLRQLNGDDLSRYAFKAMTTWGDIDDFKHYLPRIFELLSTTEFIVDTFVVLGKLDYGKWTTWSTDEQKVIKDFLLAWWTDITKNKSYFDRDTFIEIYKLNNDIKILLDRWEISFDDNSFKNLIDFLYNDYKDLTNKKKKFDAFDKESIDYLLSWLRDKIDFIEKGFFHYEKDDEIFSEKISNTLYMMENVS